MQGRDHPVLALDGMGRGQELARRLAPQDVSARGRGEAVGGVGLAALELGDLQGALETRHVGGEPALQPLDVDFLARPHRPGAGEFALPVEAVGHALSP
jgi:hypothetical protein